MSDCDSEAPSLTHWVRPTQQERSRRTLDKLLDATEGLLDDRTFDEITINDVVARAKSSVGAFYARFVDKEALLAAVYDRHQAEVAETLAAAVDPVRWEGASLGDIVERLVHFVVELYATKRGLMRALVLRGYAKPDPRYGEPVFREKMALAQVGRLIAGRAGEFRHPDPELAGSLGFLVVLATAREKLLFGDGTAAALQIQRRELEIELCRVFCAYLGIDIPGQGS